MNSITQTMNTTRSHKFRLVILAKGQLKLFLTAHIPLLTIPKGKALIIPQRGTGTAANQTRHSSAWQPIRHGTDSQVSHYAAVTYYDASRLSYLHKRPANALITQNVRSYQNGVAEMSLLS